VSDELFIVDDNANNLNLLTGILRGAGYAVRMANSGRRALAAMQRQPPQLVLLDINMPEMSGYELCEALKRDPRTEKVPIIFLSALDDVRDKVSAFRSGGVDYITKPFHAEEVLARVDSQLQLARLRSLLEQRNRELESRNAELEATQRQATHIFTTLSNVLPGAVLDGKYRIEKKIGSGGFAVVFRAEGPEGRPVAVKVLRPQLSGNPRGSADRVRIEGLSAIRIRHPSAVEVLDAGVTPAGVAYLVMELLEGHTLADELAACGALPAERAARVLLPVCEALAEAHAAGVIHRDVKPSNIFLHRSTDGEQVKVVDFGIAKLGGESELEDATTMGRLLGTPVYMSPERLLGQPYDGGADVYAAAMTLYQMLVGRLPFSLPADAGIGALVLACLSEQPRPPEPAELDAPEPLIALVMGGLDKSPAQRPTMRRLAEGLAHFLGVTASLSTAVTRPAVERPTVDSPLGADVDEK
jgi:serine/threonine protein kinase